MRKRGRMRGAAIAWIFSCAMLLTPVANSGQAVANGLKYRLRATPGNLQMNRMPGTDMPRPYEETFTFVVTNAGTTDYAGAAPSCKTLEIVVTPVDQPEHRVWEWSHGQMFCMMVTNISIGAGKRWVKKETWKLTTADLPDGKYRATATFEAEKKTASVEFEVTSVQ